MHHKHYQALAEAFRRIRDRINRAPTEGEELRLLTDLLEDVEDEVCLVLSLDNPSFDHHRFTTASGRTS